MQARSEWGKLSDQYTSPTCKFRPQGMRQCETVVNYVRSFEKAVSIFICFTKNGVFLSLSLCFSLCCDTSSIFNALKAATCSKPRLRWKYRKCKLWFHGDAKWLKVWSQVADKTELQDMWSILRASKGNISESLQLMLQCCCFYTIHDFFPLHRDLHWI